MLRPNHSIWSAYTFGVAISTVAGRFKIIFLSAVGCQVSITAPQISTLNSSSVPVKLSGEYSKNTSVPLTVSLSSRIRRVPRTAISTMPCRGKPKTTRRCNVEVEL
jgi:hypothetical protein